MLCCRSSSTAATTSTDRQQSVYHSAKQQQQHSNSSGSVYHSANQTFAPPSQLLLLNLKSGTSLDVAASVLHVVADNDNDNDNDANGNNKAETEVVVDLQKRKSTANRKKKRGQRRHFRSTRFFRKGLEEETTPVADTPQGYPGHLTPTELEACLQFRKILKNEQEEVVEEDNTDREFIIDHQVFNDMVYLFEDVEEEAYSICRYLRSGKFDIDETLRKMNGWKETWLRGNARNFFPNPTVALKGAPESVLLTQLPLVLGSGTARNGCPIVYLVTGQIEASGLECVVALDDDDIPNWAWHFFVHKLRNRIAAFQQQQAAAAAAAAADNTNPDFVRYQLTVVVDFQGLSMSLLRRILPALEKLANSMGIFPEILFNVVILSAPRFFSGCFWPIIKAFLDPATARKFEIYSDRAQDRLRELAADENLASDYGGTAPSTSELIAQDAGFSRQIVELLTLKKRRNDVATASFQFELKEGESAAINIYTNAAIDGAEVVLLRIKEEQQEAENNDTLSTVTLMRNDSESVERPYIRELIPSLRGPGDFRVTVNRNSWSPADEYFLVVGAVSQAP